MREGVWERRGNGRKAVIRSEGEGLRRRQAVKIRDGHAVGAGVVGARRRGGAATS